MTASPRTYIAFLRGVNVGGANVLPMSELRALCESIGFQSVQTYIQSGNVIFESELDEATVAAQLEGALEQKMGKRIIVSVRTAEELAQVLEANPFADAEPAKVGVMFLPEPVAEDFLAGVSTTTGEELQVGEREVYIHYVNGMGRSKLKLPKKAETGTVRNVNTVRKALEKTGVP